MVKKRPVNLNFLTLRFPITAWASVFHRLSGIFVFLFIPGLLWVLETSLMSEKGFQMQKTILQRLTVKIMVWSLLSALMYHLLAGIRHLLMDIHVGEEKSSSKRSAALVLGAGLLSAIALGIWLW